MKVFTQVFKTGEKLLGRVNRRGKKPIGFNIYDFENGINTEYISNEQDTYTPEHTHTSKTMHIDNVAGLPKTGVILINGEVYDYEIPSSTK